MHFLFLLKDGAALFYPSSLFFTKSFFSFLPPSLLTFRFNFDFVHKPQLAAKSDLFIPIGWDSRDKIDLDFRNQSLSSEADQPYNQVIVKPSSIVEQVRLLFPLILFPSSIPSAIFSPSSSFLLCFLQECLGRDNN